MQVPPENAPKCQCDDAEQQNYQIILKTVVYIILAFFDQFILIMSCPVVESLTVTNCAGINISMWGLLHHLLCPLGCIYPSVGCTIKQKETCSILILYKITKQRNHQWNIMEKQRLMSEQKDLFLANQSQTLYLISRGLYICMQS